MTKTERFKYEMMDTINLGQECHNVNRDIQQKKDQRKMAKLHGDEKLFDSLKAEIYNLRILHRQLVIMLKSRQMRMF